MINFHPIGRTGNLMFQVAATMAYGKKHRVHWGMPTDTREVPHFRKMFPNVPALDGHFRRRNFSDPSQFNYEPLPRFEDDATLVGFFQSEKYFEGYHDEVRKLFNLDIKPIDAVSIHVRRGDYVQYSGSFPPVTEEYITKALSFVERSKGINKIMFFSDDIEWCRKISHGDIDYCEEKDEFKALSLMASCKHNIIANSSFSWWASWLNPNPDKIVVSPHYTEWFGSDNGVVKALGVNAAKYLIPDSWHQIKVR